MYKQNLLDFFSKYIIVEAATDFSRKHPMSNGIPKSLSL